MAVNPDRWVRPVWNYRTECEWGIMEVRPRHSAVKTASGFTIWIHDGDEPRRTKWRFRDIAAANEAVRQLDENPNQQVKPPSRAANALRKRLMKECGIDLPEKVWLSQMKEGDREAGDWRWELLDEGGKSLEPNIGSVSKVDLCLLAWKLVVEVDAFGSRHVFCQHRRRPDENTPPRPVGLPVPVEQESAAAL